MNTSKTNGIKDKCFRNAARFVQNAIDGEPQDFERIPDEPQRTGHWILCSERLPEKEEQVLIYAWNVHYVLAKYREIRTCDGVYKMAWVTEDAYSVPREIKYEVICWMPLPEPYKGEQG